MSKRFRPIFGIGSKTEETFKDDTKRILEEKRSLEEKLKRLQADLEALKEENASLKEDLAKARQDLESKEAEVQKLKDELSKRETVEKIVQELSRSLDEILKKAKEVLREDFVRLTKEVIREFLMTDVIPKEMVVTTILEEVFGRVADLRGRITVYLSPKDVDRAFDTLGEIRDKLGDRVEIEVSSDPTLLEGEVKIETPKFVIERKHEEILEEIFREVIRRALERDKDIREGGQG